MQKEIIATSANVASEMQELKGKYQQKELAGIAHVSRSSVGHYMTGERNMPQEIMQGITESLDENILARKLLAKFSPHVVPFADEVSNHPLCFKTLATKEQLEEDESANRIAHLLAKDKNLLKQGERREIREYVNELLDEVFIKNSLLPSLCDSYNFNLPEMIRYRQKHWKELGYLK